MKNLKIYLVAVFFTCSLALAANPVSKSVIAAKQEFYKDFKKSLVVWNVVNTMTDENCCSEFVVYGYIDAQSVFQITKIKGDDEVMKKQILINTQEHPVEVQKELRGTNLAFRLKLLKH